MSVLCDYRYQDMGGPAPRTWKTLVAQLRSQLPTSGGGHAPLLSPARHPLVASSMTPGTFYWEAMTMGYGEALNYALYWLIHGIPISAPQVEALKRLAQSRITALTRAFELVPTSATEPFHLRPRDIYPLIEQSEKVHASYYLGSALAAVCAPEVLARRAKPVTLGYLFHARLLASLETATRLAVVRSVSKRHVDFLAYDTAGRVHLFEAKGTGEGFSAGALADGIDQCCDVIGVDLGGGRFVMPATRHVMASFVGKQNVPCDAMSIGHSVRTASFEIVQGVAPLVISKHPPVVPPVHDGWASVAAMVGAQSIATFMYLQAARRVNDVGAWLQFQFDPENGFDVPIRVAIPHEIHDRLERAWHEGMIRFRNGPLKRRLESSLLGEAPEHEAQNDNSADARAVLMELGKSVLSLEEEGQGFEPLPGFVRSSAARWINVAV